MKERIIPKVDLDRVELFCAADNKYRTFRDCQRHCHNICWRYYELLLDMDIARAITRGKRRRLNAQAVAQFRADDVDKQMENDYLKRSDEKAMLKGWM